MLSRARDKELDTADASRHKGTGLRRSRTRNDVVYAWTLDLGAVLRVNEARGGRNDKKAL